MKVLLTRFRWNGHTNHIISSTDSKVRTILIVSITDSGSERVRHFFKSHHQVSCLAVMENLTQMAVGFVDGSVIVYKGDITRDR